MNLTSNTVVQPDCIFWTSGHINPAHYDSQSFHYVSRVAIALNCVSSPIAAIGNGLVLMALLSTPSLHTPANALIGSLAFFDFLIGAVAQPIFVGVLASKSLFLDCNYEDSLFFIGFLLTSGSTTLMAAVSCERYMCLFLHLRYTMLVSTRKAFLVVLAIWVFWLLDTSAFFLGGVYFIIGQVSCAIMWSLSSTAIAASYAKILLLVRRHRRQIQSQQAASVTVETTSQTKLAITMGYVIWASLMCYMPTTVVVQMFLFIKQPNLSLFSAIYIAMSVQFMSSCLNPVIYCWRRQDIRQAGIATLRKLFSR